MSGFPVKGDESVYGTVIIGAGRIAAGFDTPDSSDILTHAHACQCSKDFFLKGFYDRDYRRAKEAAKKWHCHAYGGLGDAMREAEVVICCVPDANHKEILGEISQYHPKLVITEKPLASSVEEGENLMQIYGDGIPVILNYSRRFLPEFQKLRQKIKGYGKFVKGVGYYGKGIVHNGSHMIDFLRFLFGAVECLEVRPSEIRDFDGDRSRDAVLRVGTGQFHMLAIDSRIATVFEMDLFFEKARVRILDGGTLIERYQVKESAAYEGYYNYVSVGCENVDYSHAMMGLLENARGVLEDGEQSACTLEDGLAVLRLCIGIRGETL